MGRERDEKTITEFQWLLVPNFRKSDMMLRNTFHQERVTRFTFRGDVDHYLLLNNAPSAPRFIPDLT